MTEHLTLYHGSRALFSRFDPVYDQSAKSGYSLLGQGMYWTTSLRKAGVYTGGFGLVPLSPKRLFRETPVTAQVIYQTCLTPTHQEHILDLTRLTWEQMERIHAATPTAQVRRSLNAIWQEPDRDVSFAVWARKHQDVLTRAGFNGVRYMDVVNHLDPTQLDIKIHKIHILSGQKIPAALLTPDSEVLIQNRYPDARGKGARDQVVSGRELLATARDGQCTPVFRPTGLRQVLARAVKPGTVSAWVRARLNRDR